MSFPLYDILYKDVDEGNSELTTDEKKTLIQMIHKTDDKCHETIFTIIRIYGLENNINDMFQLPFDGQRTANKNNIKFDLEKFPNRLKRMLYNFIHMHNEKLNEYEYGKN